MLADVIEQTLGLGGREPRRDDADVDAAAVHRDEEHFERGGGGEVTAQEVGDALVAALREEGLGGGATEGIDPEVDDRHAGGASGVVAAGAAGAVGAVRAAALARADRR